MSGKAKRALRSAAAASGRQHRMSTRPSLTDAVAKVLEEANEPLHFHEITRRLRDRGLAEGNSQLPESSVNAVVAVDMKRNGTASRFVRVRPGVIGLRSRHQGQALDTQAGAESPPDDIAESERRVRIPYFPVYSEMRLVLPVWDRKPRGQITHMHSTVAALLGTPQDPADWTSPEEWIPARLEGPDREMAMAIWTGTGKRVNPRRIYGHWLLATNYGLLEDTKEGLVVLTARGYDFLRGSGSDAEVFMDEGEGLLKLLSLVGEQGPARPKDLLQGWGDYLKRRSRFGSDSTIKDSLYRRLRNLVERGLVSRSAGQYSITDPGLEYLNRAQDDEAATPSGELHQLLTLSKSHRASVRESVKELLANMDPIGFEHLIKRLLEAMDYQNVKVTGRSNDKGVDVVADIELGITSVREVVQAKRHSRQAVQRKELDALRGSLHRFQAVRGTLITTGIFSKGTREAAFESGVAPITLIDGEKLLDLLVEYEVGIRKKAIEILELDPEAFADSELDARRAGRSSD